MRLDLVLNREHISQLLNALGQKGRRASGSARTAAGTASSNNQAPELDRSSIDMLWSGQSGASSKDMVDAQTRDALIAVLTQLGELANAETVDLAQQALKSWLQSHTVTPPAPQADTVYKQQPDAESQLQTLSEHQTSASPEPQPNAQLQLATDASQQLRSGLLESGLASGAEESTATPRDSISVSAQMLSAHALLDTPADALQPVLGAKLVEAAVLARMAVVISKQGNTAELVRAIRHVIRTPFGEHATVQVHPTHAESETAVAQPSPAVATTAPRSEPDSLPQTALSQSEGTPIGSAQTKGSVGPSHVPGTPRTQQSLAEPESNMSSETHVQGAGSADPVEGPTYQRPGNSKSVPESVPEPVSGQSVGAVAESTPEEIVDTVPEAVSRPVPEETVDPAPEAMPKPAPDEVADSTTEAVLKPAPQEVVNSEPEAMAKTMSEPVELIGTHFFEPFNRPEPINSSSLVDLSPSAESQHADADSVQQPWSSTEQQQRSSGVQQQPSAMPQQQPSAVQQPPSTTPQQQPSVDEQPVRSVGAANPTESATPAQADLVPTASSTEQPATHTYLTKAGLSALPREGAVATKQPDTTSLYRLVCLIADARTASSEATPERPSGIPQTAGSPVQMPPQGSTSAGASENATVRLHGVVHSINQQSPLPNALSESPVQQLLNLYTQGSVPLYIETVILTQAGNRPVAIVIDQDASHSGLTEQHPVRVHLSLKTENLGLVSVDLTYDQGISCLFQSTPSASELIRNALPTLRDKLTEVGLSVLLLSCGVSSAAHSVSATGGPDAPNGAELSTPLPRSVDTRA